MKKIKFYTLKLIWVMALSLDTGICGTLANSCMVPVSHSLGDGLNDRAAIVSNHPADISCCIADLKFDGQNLKICELGTCTWSYYKGHETLYGPGKIWQNIWHHLAQFNIPIWYIGDVPLSEAHKREVGHKELLESGGSIVDTLQTLSQSLRFKTKKSVENPFAINHYRGIVVLRNRHHHETKSSIEEFRNKHPEVMIMDTAAAPYVNNKAATNKLFADPLLTAFKPDWHIYQKPTPDNTKLTAKTKNQKVTEKKWDVNHNMYVIKPINSAEGRGVIIVSKEGLDGTINKLFIENSFLKDIKDTSYSYWEKDRHNEFILESYAPSKPITVDNRHYDATMRVVFALTYHNQTIGVDFLGFYWKLPPLDLDSIGSLNDKHKSKITKGRTSSAIVNEHDQERVMQILQEALPVLYTKMLLDC